MAKPLRLDVVTAGDEKGLLSTAAGLDAVADKADKVGRQFEETAVSGGVLARELAAVKHQQDDLARAFDETGDRALLKQISAHKRYESQLKVVGKALEDVEKESETLGENAGKGLSDSLKDARNSSRGLREELAQMAPALAPFVAPVAAGSLLAVLGGGGLALGIAGQLKSPIVQGALKTLKADVSKTLHDSTAGYDTELSLALHDLDEGVSGFLADLKPGLAAIRPELSGIAKDVADGLKNSGADFATALAKSKPVLHDLGDAFDTLIKDTGTAFKGMSSGAEGAGQSIKDLTGSVGQLEIATGDALGMLSQLYGALDSGKRTLDNVAGSSGMFADVWHRVEGSVGDAINPIHGAVGAVQALHDQIDNSASSGESAFRVMDRVSMATDGYGVLAAVAAAKTKALTLAWQSLDKNLSNDQAVNAAKDAIAGVTGQIDKHSRSLDQDSAKGRINREAYEGAIQTLEQQRDALIANGTHADVAAKKFDGWVKALERAMIKAGFSKKDIEALNKVLGKDVTKTVHIKYEGKPSPYAVPGTTMKHYAAGGHYEAGQPRMVGENGPEIDIPDHSGTVIPNSAFANPAGRPMVAASSGGGQTVTVAAGDSLTATLFALIRAEVGNRYGGDVTIALGGAS